MEEIMHRAASLMRVATVAAITVVMITTFGVRVASTALAVVATSIASTALAVVAASTTITGAMTCVMCMMVRMTMRAAIYRSRSATRLSRWRSNY